jgi:UDP-glucose/GDP-mannose dehydrogenase family, central domain
MYAMCSPGTSGISSRAAELSKLHENTFRAVNIALANERAQIARVAPHAAKRATNGSAHSRDHELTLKDGFLLANYTRLVHPVRRGSFVKIAEWGC